MRITPAQNDALQMLAQLSGQTHTVLTAVAVPQGAQRWLALSVSSVRFMEVS